jgi:hypothetical protein
MGFQKTRKNNNKLNFDDYILQKENSLKEIKEASQGVQDSNAASDFFSKLGTILKGGKDPAAPTIVLVKPKEVDKLKDLLIPKYAEAERQLATNKDPIIGDKINPAFVSKNIVDIFKNLALTRSGNTSTSINNVLSQDPSIYTSSSSSGSGSGGGYKLNIDKVLSQVSLKDIEDGILKVIQPAIKAGILKWDVPVGELSPKDLFNRFVNSVVATGGQTAKELLGGDVTAGGRM